MAGNVRITGNQIQDSAVAEPKLDQEVRDRLEGGIDWKKSCRVATTAPIAVLNGGAPNLVDTVPLTVGDRILVHRQGGLLAHAQNGLYSVIVVGSGANGVWLRSSNADSDSEVTSGLTVYVSAGPTNGRKLFTLTTLDPITLGVTPLLFEAGGGGGSAAIGMPTDGSWEDGYVQTITAATTIADAVDYLNEMMALLHPLPPRLGQVNIVGDGNIFSAGYAGGSEASFKNGKIANPLAAYLIAPFVAGNKELIVGTLAAPLVLPFRTFNPISGLRAGSILRAYTTSDGFTWVPLGDNLTLDGTTNAQDSPLLTWRAYGSGGVPGVSPLGTLPNGDLYGYVQFRYSFPALALPKYLDIRLEQAVGAALYLDYLDHYKPVAGVSGGVLLDPVTPQPSGTTQILDAGPGATRRISGVEYIDATYPLTLSLNLADLYRFTYGPAAGGGTPVVTLGEGDLGNVNELLDPFDLGNGVIPAYNAATTAALARTVGVLPAGSSAATLPANLHHPHGDGLVGNAALLDFCRVCNWPAGDTNVQLNFMDEARRCIQGVGGPPFLTFDLLDIFLFGGPLPGPLGWNPALDVDYDVPDLGLQVMPSTLPPLAPANSGVLVYPQQNFLAVGIPMDFAGPNYVLRAGNRLYRSFFISAVPQAGGTITLDGLTFADIQDLPGQRAKIELRLPENVGAQWGSLGSPQGIPPFTGLYLGSPNPGDTIIPFAFTPGIHSTNGSSGDSNLYVQVRITYFDLGVGANLQSLGSLTLGP
jgi:hypothetical protein